MTLADEMRVRITFWKPWADAQNERCQGSAVGSAIGALQDAKAYLAEGRPVMLIPQDDPEPDHEAEERRRQDQERRHDMARQRAAEEGF